MTAPLPIRPDYRMMLVGSDGRVLMVSPLTAASDKEGVAMAKAASQHLLRDGACVDLWDGLRFVEKVHTAQVRT